jgi:hypothetical protein
VKANEKQAIAIDRGSTSLRKAPPQKAYVPPVYPAPAKRRASGRSCLALLLVLPAGLQGYFVCRWFLVLGPCLGRLGPRFSLSFFFFCILLLCC